jgi:mycobactin lysine-N-oxygenase
VSWPTRVAGTFAAEVILATVAVLAVVGAGPKGIAIAAKARALEAAGLDAPRVVLIDRGPVAGAG